VKESRVPDRVKRFREINNTELLVMVAKSFRENQRFFDRKGRVITDQ